MLSIKTDSGVLLAAKVRVVSRFWQRHWPFDRCLLSEGQGLLLNPGGSVHTFGMPCAIDVAFLDHTWRVLRVVSALPPARWALAPRATSVVLLLAAQQARRAGLDRGMSLSQDNSAQAAHPFATTLLRRVAAQPTSLQQTDRRR